MSFNGWLFVRENVELTLARFLEDVLDKIGAQILREKQAGAAHADASNYARAFWPGPSQDGRYILPPGVGVSGYVVFQKHAGRRAKTNHAGGRLHSIELNLGPVLDAPDATQAARELESLKSAVHHEAEHLRHPGTQTDIQPDDSHDEKQQKSLAYMMNDGEMRAHAREMARAYAQQFPYQPFDLSKARAVLPRLNTTHANYFTRLSGPPRDRVAQYVQAFLPQYQVSLSR